MPTFPRSEARIVQLAQFVANGLEEARHDFPTPPVASSDLRTKVEAYLKAVAATNEAEGQLRIQHALKDEVVADLVDSVKADLRYAELTVRHEPVKLGVLGWGPRRERSKLEKPGQVLNMQIVAEGDTWVELSWRKPPDGGKVAAYTIKRRKPGSRWMTVATVIPEECRLEDQPRGITMEYIVVATNRAGESPPSGTMTVVL